MKFEDLLNKYKNNSTTKEETEFVLEEIDKYILISEYIEEENSNDKITLNYLDKVEEDKNEQELKKLKKSLRKRNTSIIIGCIIGVMLMSFVYKHSVYPVINNMYYNPSKSTIVNNISDFDICMDAFIRLHGKGNWYYNTYIENTNIGNYDMTLYKYDAMGGSPESYEGKVEKGKLKLSSDFFMNLGEFAYSTYPETSRRQDALEKSKGLLSELPNYLTVEAAISFEKDLSLAAVIELINNMQGKDIHSTWIAVRNSDINGNRQVYPLIGISINTGVAHDINNKYPGYEWFESYIKNNEEYSEEMLRSALQANINLLTDNMEFFKALEDGGEEYYSNYYKETKEYIKNNGINSYGIMVIGTPSEILKLSEENNICQIDITNIEFKK